MTIMSIRDIVKNLLRRRKHGVSGSRGTAMEVWQQSSQKLEKHANKWWSDSVKRDQRNIIATTCYSYRYHKFCTVSDYTLKKISTVWQKSTCFRILLTLGLSNSMALINGVTLHWAYSDKWSSPMPRATKVHSAFCPSWDGKMSISIQIKYRVINGNVVY